MRLSKVAAAVMLTTACASAQTASPPNADAFLVTKFQDLKWQKILPELGDRSPEIVTLHVDPKTQATQLMIRVPKDFHVTRHWHSANEAHVVVSGIFILQPDGGDKQELGPGSFNYTSRKMVHQGWTKSDQGALLFITVDGAWDVNWVDQPPSGEITKP